MWACICVCIYHFGWHDGQQCILVHKCIHTHAVRNFVCTMLKGDASARPTAAVCEKFFSSKIRSAGESKEVDAARQAAQVYTHMHACTCVYVYVRM